jgi:hypothetical protein
MISPTIGSAAPHIRVPLAAAYMTEIGASGRRPIAIPAESPRISTPWPAVVAKVPSRVLAGVRLVGAGCG